MLRFVNCKFDFVIENSRRLLKNSTVSLTQQCQFHAYGFSRQDAVQSTVYRCDTGTLVPCSIKKDVESSMWSQHHMIHYKDLYECYLRRLRKLYEALNTLSAVNGKCKFTSRSGSGLHRESYSVEDIITNVDQNIEFMYPRQQDWPCKDTHFNAGLRLALMAHENRKSFHNLPSSQCFLVPEFEIPDNSKTFNLMCSKSDEPKDIKEESKDEKGPSKDQLDAMQGYLIENFPKFLSKRHNYDIYTKDIEFVNNWYMGKSYSTKGTMNYSIEIARLKLFVHLRLANIRMTLVKVTNHKEDGSIKLRWRIVGLSHSKALWNYILARGSGTPDDAEWLDGFSTFYLNSEGLVWKHCMDRVLPESENIKEEPSMMETLGLKIEMPLST